MSSIMDATVKEICESMKNNPDRWKINTHTVDDTRSGIRYWTSNINTTITQIWTGSATVTVFGYDQGVEIFNSYCLMCEHKASEAQKKVIRSFKPKPSYTLVEIVSKEAKWYEFWK